MSLLQYSILRDVCKAYSGFVTWSHVSTASQLCTQGDGPAPLWSDIKGARTHLEAEYGLRRDFGNGFAF